MFDVNTILFVVFPYVAVALAVIVTAKRLKNNPYSVTSHSSQFLESRKSFWGLTLWHWGLLPVLLIHLFVLLLPGPWLKIVSDPMRLYVLEITAVGLGLCALTGIGILFYRRIVDAKMRAVSKPPDYAVLLVLFLQILSGIGIAFHYKWGASWAAHTAVPWLWSLIKLSPDTSYITMMPHLVKFHMFNAFLIVALIPFTKLVHFLTFPISYLIRPPQVVIWGRNKVPASKSS